ncbi:MAG: class I SAM-dependent methyltransferase [Bacteroidales bacterium]|jgi:predicted O-methyltransferase YrrM|nr:class I SAM-dependent methyltransferase [Bacteroidales bacterium]HOI33025.1 class I SAM-dependent methyltransferase [Bacteroidales bacterium]
MIPLAVQEYIGQHSSPVDTILDTIYRQTYLRHLYPRMLSGPLQARLLDLICKIHRPKTILEVGTFTAYATIAMALATADDAHLITIEANEELEDTILDNLQKAEVFHKVSLKIGNALELIPKLNTTFDLIFLDADKLNYPAYYELLVKRLTIGGILLTDNVLWDGKVADPSITDPETTAIRSFNQQAAADENVEQIILPIRDGLSLIRKKC